MSTAIADVHEVPAESGVNYLNATYGVKSWLLTLDHKRIGLLYLATITLTFVVGGMAAVFMRLNLIEPQGALVEPETYNKLFSIHGIIMVFFFLVPSIPATLGNFLIPLMIGARDVAFPKLNLMSWYIFVTGAACVLYAVMTGGVDTGWTFYTPYSSSYSHTQVIAAAVGIFIAGFSSILTGLNFLVTIHKMRAPGMTWFRLPLFIWAMYATSLIFVLGTPVIAVTLLLLAAERLLHVGIFDPAIGGDPLLFQHLFWFYSHPAVYIMILPGMGVISELITAFSRKKIFGYSFVAFSSLGIAIISFVVWGHHMFVTGQSLYAGLVFSVLSFVVAIPSARTTGSVVAVFEDGDRCFLSAPGACDQFDLTPADLESEIAAGSRALHLGYAGRLPMLDGERLGKIMRMTRDLGALTSLDVTYFPDPRWPQLMKLMPEIDVFCPNLVEATAITGRKSAVEAAAALVEAGVQKFVAVTDGANGAVVHVVGESQEFIPARPVKVIDTTGAGDAFIAGVLAAWYRGSSWRIAGRMGAFAASIAVTSSTRYENLRSFEELLSELPVSPEG